ncbi:MAG: antitoxin VapB family protein [Nanoarchaeota archaeon]|nr:antitoxin VapB family protein [Nanoarchaeota archaeon]
MVTTIQIEEKLKEKLDQLKIHHRESYNELITRLVNTSAPSKFDRESLVETIEILSDPEAMREIARGIEDFNKGKFKSLRQIRKELS